MKYGDLSNKTAPRVYVVFEGLVASVPDDNLQEYSDMITARKVDWFKAIKCYQLNDMVCAKLIWLSFHRDVNFTVVSWLPKEASYGIDVFLQKNGIPAGLIMSTPYEISMELVRRPDVVAILDPDPWHVLTFGSKAKTAFNAEDIGGIF